MGYGGGSKWLPPYTPTRAREVSGAASGNGKRKRGKDCNREAGGSGSGDGRDHPSDPRTCTVAEDAVFAGVREDFSSFSGVRVRVVVEIKDWAGKGFHMDVKAPKDVVLVAAIVYDLAQLYLNPELPVTSLNIHRVELNIRKIGLHVTEDKYMGKGLLDKYVRDYLLTSRERGHYAPRNIAELKEKFTTGALAILKDLKQSAVTAELKTKDDQIASLEAAHIAELKAKDDQITSLEVAHTAELKAKDDQIASLEAAHIAELKAKDDQITSLGVAHTAELKAKDDSITRLMEMFSNFPVSCHQDEEIPQDAGAELGVFPSTQVRDWYDDEY